MSGPEEDFMDRTRELAEFVAGTAYSRLPNDAVEAAKRCLIDWLGVALAGSKEPAGSILAELMAESGGKREATVLGKGFKTSTLNAALINGTMSHVLDYDDVFHKGASLHPSAPLFPALLAVAERDHLGGRDLLCAFVLGFEVETRLGQAIGPRLMEKALHPTPHLGAFGAAASAGKLLGLTSEQMVNAFGLAFTEASGVLAAFGTMGKSFQVGRCSANGLLAAGLARKGFTGPAHSFDGDGDFFKVHGGPVDEAVLAAGLGRDYSVTRDSFKLYASCAATHAVIDAALELRRKHALKASDVSEIVCQVRPMTLNTAAKPEPLTALEGKFSVQYCVSAALVDGIPTEGQFSDEKVQEPVLAALARKVKLTPNPAFDLTRAVVTVRTVDGKTYEQRTDCVKGTPANPVGWADLESKFRRLASTVLPVAGVDRVVMLIENFEALDDVGTLIKRCVARPARRRRA